jgi:hypothetical protein
MRICIHLVRLRFADDRALQSSLRVTYWLKELSRDSFDSYWDDRIFLRGSAKRPMWGIA